jgi:hypothetical protein
LAAFFGIDEHKTGYGPIPEWRRKRSCARTYVYDADGWRHGMEVVNPLIDG